METNSVIVPPYDHKDVIAGQVRTEEDDVKIFHVTPLGNNQLGISQSGK